MFYLITFISIPTLALYGPVKNHRDWILSSGSHTGVLVGGFLEVIVALAGIGTAVTLYPVVKRQNEGVALGFVAARVLEAVMIFTGVISLLSLVTLRQDLGGAAGANSAALVTTGASHVAVYNWTFLLSQSLMPGINALLLGSLLYRVRLCPASFPRSGSSEPRCSSAPSSPRCSAASKLGSPELAAVPVGAWELSLGLWLVIKGFKPSPITAGTTEVTPRPPTTTSPPKPKGRNMIEIDGLTKRYGDKTAVDGLSFVVEPGVVTGFLGPNGAGKSTTMRMIAGLDRPTAGRCGSTASTTPRPPPRWPSSASCWTPGRCTRACRPATTCWRWPGRPASAAAGSMR